MLSIIKSSAPAKFQIAATGVLKNLLNVHPLTVAVCLKLAKDIFDTIQTLLWTNDSW